MVRAPARLQHWAPQASQDVVPVPFPAGAPMSVGLPPGKAQMQVLAQGSARQRRECCQAAWMRRQVPRVERWQEQEPGPMRRQPKWAPPAYLGTLPGRPALLGLAQSSPCPWGPQRPFLQRHCPWLRFRQPH